MSKEFKGTKGKWQWNPARGNRLAILENEYGYEICNFGDDTTYYPTEGTEPDIYDAKLIVKAPEMLELLQYFIENNMLSVAGEELAEKLINEILE